MSREMIVAVGSLVLLSLVAGAPADDAGILKFSFCPSGYKGISGQPSMREGFTPVHVTTDYGKARGHGWIGVKGEVASDWVERRGPLNSRARRGPNDLLAPWIAGGGTFAAAVPNGKYLVTVCLGDWGEYEFYDFGSSRLLVQGKEVSRTVRNRENIDQWLYKLKYADYSRKRKLYDRYVKGRFNVVTVEAEVADGRLTIQSRGDRLGTNYVGAMNYAVISPAARQADHRKFLADLDAKMRADFDKRFPTTEARAAYCDAATAEEKQRGFALVDTAGEVAQPWTHAARTNRLKVLTGYATRGEFEPISFAVVPLRDLGAMTCTCTDLTGPGGAKVPASAVKVGYVKYWDMVDKRARPKAVRPQPHLLMDRNVIAETESRVTRQWWLTVHAGPAAAGGTYEGTVTVSAAKGGKAEVPVRFDVIGLTLDPPGASMLLNYSLPWSQLFYGDDDARWRQIERELRLQRDHGMTSVAVSGLHLPVKDEDTAQWERFLDLYKEVGFPRPVYMAGTMNLYNQFKNLLDPKQQQAYCDVFRRLDAAAKKKGQKAIYSVGDELTNDGREALTALVSKITHDRIPEIETISDINGYRELMLSAPYLNAAGFNNGWHGGYKTNRRGHDLIVRTVIERVKAAGCTPWFINGSKGRYPFGVFFWKMQSVGLAGKCEWHFHAHTSDPYNPFDSNQFNAFGSLVFPVCIPTVLMEQCREGIDDLRYVRTLQRVVAEKAKAAQGDPVLAGRVAAAREALDYWTDQVPDRLYTAHTPDGSGEHTGKDFPEARLRQFRDDVAGHLCRLLELRSERLYPAEVVLASFENGSRDGWTRKVGLADRHATHGKTSAELAFTDKQTYFDAWGRMNVKDWRGCRALRLDAFNPQDRPVTLVLTIRDQLASAVNAEASARKTVAFDLKPGANSLTVPLVGIQDDSGKRPLDLSCVFNLFFTVRGAKGDVTVYVDHLRLAQHD